MGSAVSELELQARQQALQVGHCWLLMAQKHGPASGLDNEALLSAAVHFASAGLSCEAAHCSASAGHLRGALAYLDGIHDAKAVSIGFLCAALLGEGWEVVPQHAREVSWG